MEKLLQQHKVYIVDDEQKSREALVHILEKYCPNVQIIGVSSNIDDAFQNININTPDILFLDVEMPNGSGFDLLAKFDKIPFSVVFVTGFDKYAMQAIKFSCLDYILKPISIKDVMEIFEKIDNLPIKKEQKIETLLNNFQANATRHKIGIPVGDGYEFLGIDDIIYLEAEGNYTNLFLNNNKKVLSTRTLGDYETIFENYPFVRIHRKHIINLNYLSKYYRGDGGYVLLYNNIQLDVSRRKKENLLNKINAI